jgi:5-methylcytosine-specific restriction endonuclease McrA
VTRDWTQMRAKCDREQFCRIGGSLHAPPDAAHIIQRSRVPPGLGAEHELNCIPLCRRCHDAYDERRLDILPNLTRGEMAYAVGLVGMLSALERVTNRRWVPA